MKTKALILLLAIMPFGLKAVNSIPKDQYANGQVFLLNNDTLRVYIKIDKLLNLQNGIQYVDTMGMEYNLKPEDAKGFCMFYPDDTMYFESRNDIQKVLFKPKNNSQIFIHRVQKGKLPLYYFIETKFEMEGLDQIEVERARYFVNYANEWYPVSKDRFRNDFQKIFSLLKGDGFGNVIKPLQLEIGSGRFKFEETPLLIKEINALITEK